MIRRRARPLQRYAPVGHGKDKGGQRYALFSVVFVAVVLAALFLPGPKGVIRVLGREHRADRLERALTHLTFEIDSLDSCARWFSNPDSARKHAVNTFGRLPRRPATDTTGSE